MRHAREAFEEVKRCYQELSDEEKHRKYVNLITSQREAAIKERKRLLKKGATEEQLGALDSNLKRDVAKMFAENEIRRIRSEDYKRNYAAKERLEEEEEKKKIADAALC